MGLNLSPSDKMQRGKGIWTPGRAASQSTEFAKAAREGDPRGPGGVHLAPQASSVSVQSAHLPGGQ